MSLSKRFAIKYIRTKLGLLSALSKRKAAEKAFQFFCTPQYRNKKKPTPIFEKAENLNFHFKGSFVQGYRWNHPADKKVLILHGFESGIVNFDRYIKPLIEKGYEVLGFDAPAHGRSSGKMINVLIYKNLIHHIYNTYGPIHSYIAHSMGGLAVSLFLEETKHDKSCRLVLIAPATETSTAADNLFAFFKLDGEVRKEFDKLIAEKSEHPAAWFSVARAARNIKAQVLFLQDKEDDMTPFSDVIPIIEKKYSNFKFIISQGLGHRRIYRDSKSFKEIMDFL